MSTEIITTIGSVLLATIGAIKYWKVQSTKVEELKAKNFNIALNLLDKTVVAFQEKVEEQGKMLSQLQNDFMQNVMMFSKKLSLNDEIQEKMVSEFKAWTKSAELRMKLMESEVLKVKDFIFVKGKQSGPKS